MFSLTYDAKVAAVPQGELVNNKVQLVSSEVEVINFTTVLHTNASSGVVGYDASVGQTNLPGPFGGYEDGEQEEVSSWSEDQWDIQVEHKFPDPEFYEQMIEDMAVHAQATYGISWPPAWLKSQTEGVQPPEHRDQWIPIDPSYRTAWYRLLRDIREFHDTGLLAPYSNPKITINDERYLRQNHYEYKWVSWYVKKRLDNLTFGQAQILFDNEIPSIFVLQEEYYEEMDDEEIRTYYDDWYFRIKELCASCIETDYTKLMTRHLISACCRDNHKTCDYCEWRAHCFHMFESYKRNSEGSIDRDRKALARC
jgi:hypothetical protein